MWHDYLNFVGNFLLFATTTKSLTSTDTCCIRIHFKNCCCCCCYSYSYRCYYCLYCTKYIYCVTFVAVKSVEKSKKKGGNEMKKKKTHKIRAGKFLHQKLYHCCCCCCCCCCVYEYWLPDFVCLTGWLEIAAANLYFHKQPLLRFIFHFTLEEQRESSLQLQQ